MATLLLRLQGKRLGLVGEDEQLVWLRRQGEKHGFRMAPTLVGGSDLLQSRKGESRIGIRRTRYDGVLQVTQPEPLVQAMGAGIGPAKAFGCGLLLIKRLGE